jgi:hypothetical protein
VPLSSSEIAAVTLVAGAILLAAAVIFIQAYSFEAPRRADAAADWLQSLGVAPDAAPSAAERIEMVQRLALVREPWCREVLHEAARQERDPDVLAAIDRVLSTL